jgi:hypothetical protein
MARYNATEEPFEEVTILDMPALFTSLRLDRATVPAGYHVYEVRHDDDHHGDAVQIARDIMVNHWGSLITRDEIKLPDDGYLDIEPDALNFCNGDCDSMSSFMEKYPVCSTREGNYLKAGDYLHFKIGENWEFFYPIIRVNKGSISVLPPKSVRPSESVTIHRVSKVWNFSSRSPRMRINNDTHVVYIQRRSENKNVA